jgi:hypothetical protein
MRNNAVTILGDTMKSYTEKDTASANELTLTRFYAKFGTPKVLNFIFCRGQRKSFHLLFSSNYN